VASSIRGRDSYGQNRKKQQNRQDKPKKVSRKPHAGSEKKKITQKKQDKEQRKICETNKKLGCGFKV
jgi:hypothetical protein